MSPRSEAPAPIKATYAYYPGCTLHATAREYDVSARLVCDGLGIELRELEDWTCCGASSAHSTNHLLGIALPAQELRRAEQLGMPLTVACAMCYSRLRIAAHELSDKANLEFVSETGGHFTNSAQVVHLAEVLDRIKQEIPVVRPLADLKVASYYGCLLVRPKEIMRFDDPENPQMLDRIARAVGADPVDWAFKTECCGASLPLTRPDIVVSLSYRIISQARRAGADCIAVACPMCHSNLDTRQSSMKAKHRDMTDMPVLYFTQLVGLGMGLSPGQLQFSKHFVDPVPMLREKRLI